MEFSLQGVFRTPVTFEDRSSYIEAQIIQIYQEARLSKHTERLMLQTLAVLQTALRPLIPDIRLTGSLNSGFATCSSDLDIALFLPPDSPSFPDPLDQLNSLLPSLQCLPIYRSHKLLSSARVPIIEVQVETQGVRLDVDVIPHPHGEQGYRNSCLLQLYGSIHPYVVVLGVVIKTWARKRGINDTFRGDGLSPYAYVLLLIAYLQRLQPFPLLPFLQNPDPTHNFAFRTDISDDIRTSRSVNVSISSLLAGFFHYYSVFDWEHYKVDICSADNRKNPDFQMVIQDPFDRNRNLTDVLRKPGAALDIKREFRRADEILSGAHDSLTRLFV